MKHLYFRGFMLLACMALCFTSLSYGQCFCSAGVPATAITQSITIAPTTASALTYSFQQFNPAIGNLSCVTLKDTISGVSVSGAINTGARTDPPGYLPVPYVPYSGPPVQSDSTIFEFLLALTNVVSGPGININNTFTTMYGPDTLSYFGTPGDTTTHGPDNVIPNPTNIANTGGNAAYLGTGSVNFIYTINGGMVDVIGGPNYRTKVTTVFGGTLNLTYYWCPAAPLNSVISNFSAFKKNGTISLQWMASSDQAGLIYDIQYSNDQAGWATAGTVPAGSAPVGTVAQYQYQYRPASTDEGVIYFRIQRRDPEGKLSYSVVKTVNLQQQDKAPGIQVYPNPVIDRVAIQFDEQQTGAFLLELVNPTGQVIQKKQVQMGGSSVATLELNSHPARGIYFLRAQRIGNNQQFLTKVVVD